MRTLSFVLTFAALFFITYVFLGVVDALPEPRDTIEAEPVATPIDEPVATEPQNNPQMPVRIAARDIGVNATVSNPNSTDVAVLDEALLHGAVRYPTSAQLGQEGTVLIFGHSSYLPVVRNQAYKAFNSIQNLKQGQIISVYSDGLEYRYAVTGVRLANAEDDVVELPTVGRHLTLVTCDSFGTKSDRFIVTADLEGTYAI